MLTEANIDIAKNSFRIEGMNRLGLNINIRFVIKKGEKERFNALSIRQT